MEKRKLLISSDPGHDDAIMLTLAIAYKEFEILGVIASSGNQTLEKTSTNALNVLNYLESNALVYKGSNKPIIKDVEICEAIHGKTGLDGFIFPKHNKKVCEGNGILFIIDTLLKNDDVTVVITGPMTDFAKALIIEPEIKKHIKDVYVMGGSTESGNVTPAAEFNVYCDPEAAHIVFNSNLEVYMVGLNVTRKVLVYDSIIDRMEKINNKASVMFCNLMRVFNENQRKTFADMDAGPLHDPVTLVSIIDKDVVKYDFINVSVDLSHGESYGRTNCNTHGYIKMVPNVHVATSIDVNKYWDVIENSLRKF